VNAGKAFVNDPIAGTLRSASIAFARHAIRLSENCSWDGNSTYTTIHETENRRVAEQAIGAVIVAVAGVDGLINEILSDASDPASPKGNIRNITENAYRRWGRLWTEGAFARKLNAVEKCDMALAVADLPGMPSDGQAVENMKALIALRNELVHSEPKYRRFGHAFAQGERALLERRLNGKFQLNTKVPSNLPFIWQRCLGVGCATWAVDTVSDFENTLFEALGISTRHGPIIWD